VLCRFSSTSEQASSLPAPAPPPFLHPPRAPPSRAPSAMARPSLSRPFLAYYDSEEESNVVVRSIATSTYPTSTPGNLSSTDGEADLNDLGSVAYQHHRSPHHRHSSRYDVRNHHGNRGGLRGLGAPTLSINTTKAASTPGHSRDADLDALRQSLDALPATRLRELILQVAISNPRFQRAVQTKLQVVNGGLIGNADGGGDITGTEKKEDQIGSKMTPTATKKRAPYVPQTPPITPTTPRSSIGLAVASTARRTNDGVEEEEAQRGRPSWKAFRGRRLVKEATIPPTTRKTRRPRKAPASAGDKPQSFSDSHVKRSNSGLFDLSDSSATRGRPSDPRDYHPGECPPMPPR
jgi:hypothetical protein